MGANEISAGRKAIYQIGIVLIVIGAISFLSTFLTAALHANSFNADTFDSVPIRAFGGMILMVIGGVLTNLGRMGLAGSGVVLDPEQAREDVKPWSKMAGGVINDTISEIDLVKNLAEGNAGEEAPTQIIKVRCRACQALNDETAKYCNQCGQAI